MRAHNLTAIIFISIMFCGITAALISGCKKPADEGTLGGPCSGDGTCNSGLVCRNHVCAEETGAIGSACGSCNPQLTCVTDAPDGYCTKTCADSDECGDAAFCYNTEDLGPICLRACQRDGDCRPGYSCQGDAGTPVCFPDTSANAVLSGCYSQYNDIVFQLWFDGAGQFLDIEWTSISGTIMYSGTYLVSGGQLYLYYDDDETVVYTLVVTSQGILLDGVPYYYTGDECS